MTPYSSYNAGLLTWLGFGFTVSFLVFGVLCTLQRFTSRLQSYWQWLNTTEPSNTEQNRNKAEGQTNEKSIEVEMEYEEILENDVRNAKPHVYDGLNNKQQQQGTNLVLNTKDISDKTGTNNTPGQNILPGTKYLKGIDKNKKTNDVATTNDFPRTKVVIPEVFREPKKSNSVYHLYFEPLGDTYNYAYESK